MNKVNWNEVKETAGFERPTPGGYIAKIVGVTDLEDKQYLKIEWDFAEGSFKGHYQELFDAKGFWAGSFVRSYKETALGFFKAFKTSVEESNKGYTFDYSNPRALSGKLVGIVLGEEEYQKRDGSIKKRLYVSQTRSIGAIQKGDFEVPAFKPLQEKSNTPIYAVPTTPEFEDSDDPETLPF